MTKYSFVLLSGEAGSFLQSLEDLGVMDISRSEKPVDEKSAKLLKESEDCLEAIRALEALNLASDPDQSKLKPSWDYVIDDPLELFQRVSSKKKELKVEIDRSYKEMEDARAWGCFDPEALEDLERQGLKIRFYKLSKKAYDPSWAQEYALQEIADNGHTVWFVTVSDDPSYSFPADEIPRPKYDLKEAEGLLADAEGELIACKGLLYSLKDSIPDLRKRQAKSQSALQRYLADAGAGKAADDLITTFEGFAPAEEEERLCKAFDAMDGVIYLKGEASKEDNPPIKLRGNWFTRMFTVLTDMYGRPEYNEFDPTPYLSVFFLLFFAMCMGDAGYGLALVVIGLLLRRSKGMKDLSPLVTTLGAGTFVIGIVMHTFFGYDISQAAWVPSWLKKCMVTGNIMGFDANMVISVLIGIVHLSLAFILKAVYATRKNGFMNSLGTWGWTLLIVGGVIVGGVSLTGVLSSTVTKWIIIALGVVSAIGIFLLSDIHRNPLKNIAPGLWETYNTATGLLGDVLSYLRLYALGLAGGMLGKAFNDIAAMTVGDWSFGPGWIAFIVIFLVGHALNLAMCCLGAFVHPLRLNFLEFFKNSGYEGKGRIYRPITNKQNQ
ncbi:MAG: ATPase V [Bacteroidales bacterium]|nr:ATPase V [Bacteroidales bacterium]